MIQAIAVAITLFFIYRQVRTQTASNVVETLTVIHRRWSEESMQLARCKVCADYVNNRFEFQGVAAYIAEYMEELGVYIRIKAVSPSIMWESQSWYIEHYYAMFAKGIERNRQHYHDEQLYLNFENLYNTMIRISKTKGLPAPNRGDEDLVRFAEDEIRQANAFLGLQEVHVPH